MRCPSKQTWTLGNSGLYQKQIIIMLMKKPNSNVGFVIIPKNASTSLHSYFQSHGYHEVIGAEDAFGNDFTVVAVIQDPVVKFAKGFSEVYMRSMTDQNNDPTDIRDNINACISGMKHHNLENFFYRLLSKNTLWKETHLKLQCRQIDSYKCNKTLIKIEDMDQLPSLMGLDQPVPQKHESCEIQQKINRVLVKIINDAKYTPTLNNVWNFIFPDVEFYDKYFPSTHYDIENIRTAHSIEEHQ